MSFLMLMMIIIIIMAVEPLLHCHIPFDVISNGMANGFTAEGLNLDHA